MAAQVGQTCCLFTRHLRLYKQSVIRDINYTFATQSVRLSNGRRAYKPKTRDLEFHSNPLEITVYNTGAFGSSRSVVVYIEGERYLFNFGEETLRLGLDLVRTPGVTKWNTIFVTHNSWENVGGLFGIMQNRRTWDDEARGGSFRNGTVLDVMGPPKCDTSYNNNRTFTTIIDAKLRRIDVDKPHATRLMTVTPIPIYPEGSTNDEAAQNDMCVVYVCSPTDTERSFDTECIGGTGLRRRELEAVAIRGLSMVAWDGRVFTPDDITITKQKGTPPFIVVECPTEEHMKPLFNNATLRQYQKPTEAKLTPNVVVHLTPAHIEQKPEYQQWIDGFQQKTNHLIVNEKCPDVPFEPMTEAQVSHNMLSDKVFPLLHRQEKTVKPFKPYTQKGNKFYASRKVVFKVPRTLHRFTRDDINTKMLTMRTDEEIREKALMNPPFRVVHEHLQKYICGIMDKESMALRRKARQLVVGNICRNTTEVDLRKVFTTGTTFEFKSTPHELNGETQRAVVTFKTESEVDEWVKLDEDFTINGTTVKLRRHAIMKQELEYPEVVFLGTGSSSPSKLRSNAAILIHYDADSCMLLDCAEGTWAQMCRLYGQKGAEDVLRKMKFVFISHLHTDHHMGLTGILRQRWRVLESDGVKPEPLVVFASYQLHYWLQTVDRTAGIPVEHMYRVLDAEGRKNMHVDYHGLMQELGVQQVKLVPVSHHQYPFGIVVRLLNSYTLVYSGDTTPCLSLKRAGMRCDLLIHEATQSDAAYETARSTNHSTVSQAIAMGQSMEAKSIILTHFSPRFQAFPLPQEYPNNVGFAFDFMKIRPTDTKILALFVYAMRKLYRLDEHEYRVNRKPANYAPEVLTFEDDKVEQKRTIAIPTWKKRPAPNPLMHINSHSEAERFGLIKSDEAAYNSDTNKVNWGYRPKA